MIICFIIGILSILYGICIMRAASGTMFFMVWFVIGACLLALGICIRFHVLSTIPETLKGSDHRRRDHPLCHMGPDLYTFS